MNINNQEQDEYDKEFYLLLLEIENRLDTLDKYSRLKIESWCRKLCQITNNREWKKNRNLHAIWILDMIINNHFEDPYNKFAPEGSIPIISKSIVKSKLSNKFNQIMEMASNYGNNENQQEIQISDQYINNPENPQNVDRNMQNYNNNNHDNARNQTNYSSKSLHTKNKNSFSGNINNQVNQYNERLNKSRKDIYQDEFEKMKELIDNLREEISFKDEIIRKQDEEKNRMEDRISELERILKGLVMSKEK